MVAVIGNPRVIPNVVVVAVALLLALAPQAKATVSCSLRVCETNTTECSDEDMGGLQADCTIVASNFCDSVQPSFCQCAFTFSTEFNADENRSEVSSATAACRVVNPEIDEVDCAAIGMTQDGPRGCVATPDEPADDGPTDEECQDMGVVTLRSSGSTLEEAQAAYLDSTFGQAYNESGCAFLGTTAGGGGAPGGAPNEGQTAQGPDYNFEEDGVQNCTQSSQNGVITWSCDNFYESPGASTGATIDEGLVELPPDAPIQEHEVSIGHPDDTSTEVDTVRTIEQVDPGLTQETVRVTETQVGVDGTTTGTTETETTTLRFADGSQTQTTRVTERDGAGNVTGTTVSGTSTPQATSEMMPGEEEARTASGEGDCALAPACSGDEIDCAVLQQQWFEICGFENDVPNVQAEVDQITSEEIIDEDVDVDETVTGFLNNSGFLGNRSCPAPLTVNTIFAGTLSFDLDPICQFAGYISFLLLSLAAFISGRIFLGGI